MKMFRRSEGFTLVELMVVVLIIGILIAIAVPIFNAARANAQRNSCQANQRTIEGAYQSYLASGAAEDNNYADVKTHLSGTYVQTWPYCPSQNTVEYQAAAGTGESVNITCSYAGAGSPHETNEAP